MTAFILAAFTPGNSPVCAVAEADSYPVLVVHRRRWRATQTDASYRLLILPTHCWRALVAADRVARAARNGAHA